MYPLYMVVEAEQLLSTDSIVFSKLAAALLVQISKYCHSKNKLKQLKKTHIRVSIFVGNFADVMPSPDLYSDSDPSS